PRVAREVRGPPDGQLPDVEAAREHPLERVDALVPLADADDEVFFPEIERHPARPRDGGDGRLAAAREGLDRHDELLGEPALERAADLRVFELARREGDPRGSLTELHPHR